MITRVEITLGLLSLLGVIAITALVGVGEFGDNGRMLRAEVGYDSRSVESGAQMFNQYCAPCHGINAAGLNCPTLDETSGLHGGDLAEGVAWRLEEVNWNRNDPYGYVFSTIAAGRTLSTRPDRYPAQDPKNMAMPAWSQHYGGPLREEFGRIGCGTSSRCHRWKSAWVRNDFEELPRLSLTHHALPTFWKSDYSGTRA